MKSKVENISPTVVALGVVSFFTDLSSEMIYPLLPIFLSSVLGVGAFTIGLIEGIAEATASTLKFVSGYLTDKVGQRKPFVFAGYGLSSLVRPLIGLANNWPLVLVLRFIDRVGKGIRTSPRDALIAEVSDNHFIGQSYGFHRAMDHAGAVLGPLVAVFLLRVFGFSLRSVFLFAAIPAAVVIILVIFFFEEGRGQKKTATDLNTDLNAKKFNQNQNKIGHDFKLFLLAITLFTLGNSTDAFLLLRLNMVGVEATGIALLWSLFNIIKMVSTYLGGRLSDRLGQKPLIIAGWVYYAAIYLMFALLKGRVALITIFLLYGIYFGLTEPAEKSWVASFVPHELKGRAFGYYHSTTGFASLLASMIFGFIWQKYGHQYAFITGGIIALLGSLLIAQVRKV